MTLSTLYKSLFFTTIVSCASSYQSGESHVERFYNYHYTGSKNGFEACKKVRTNLKGVDTPTIDNILNTYFKTLNSTISDEDCKNLKIGLERICKRNPKQCLYPKRLSKN